MKKYQQIYQILKEQILKKNIWSSFSASEERLKEIYQVSRDPSVSPQALAEEGFIGLFKEWGRKFLDKPTLTSPVSQLTSYQEIVKASGLPQKPMSIRLENQYR